MNSCGPKSSHVSLIRDVTYPGRDLSGEICPNLLARPTPDPPTRIDALPETVPWPLDTRRVRSASPPRGVGPAATARQASRRHAEPHGAICFVCTPPALPRRPCLGTRARSRIAPPHLAGAPIATTHTPQAQRGHPTCVNRSLKWRLCRIGIPSSVKSRRPRQPGSPLSNPSNPSKPVKTRRGRSRAPTRLPTPPRPQGAPANPQKRCDV